MRLCHVCKLAEVFRQDASKCRPCYNAYMRKYLAERYAARRQMAIDYLGGKCSKCEATTDLELDHIDRSTKSIDIAKLILAADAELFFELKKCQVLCKTHHDAKTSEEMGVPHGGGAKGKRNCPCELCKNARTKYNQARRKSKPV